MEDEKPENVWTDGCYDMVHYGHANQLRQAKKMGKNLIVGIHSDGEIMRNKGMTVYTMNERKTVLESIRWVDVVVIDAPYVTTVETLDKYDCEFCVHGNDVTTDCDGNDTYRIVKACERYRECDRTRLVSTTDLLGRILCGAPVVHSSNKPSDQDSKYLDSLLGLFKEGLSEPNFSQSVVYVSGAFDILHPELINYLARLRLCGTFLLVGVYSDECIKEHYRHTPVLSAKERSLCLLACRYVDWVVIDAPYAITSEFISENKILHVFPGDCDASPEEKLVKYRVAIESKCFQDLDTGMLSGHSLITSRIISSREIYLQKLLTKKEKDPLSIK